MNNIKKVVLIGDKRVGKSAWLRRLLKDEFSEEQKETIGVKVKRYCYSKSQEDIEIIIWDTAGAEKFEGFRRGYYLNADAAIIFYDISSPSSLNSMHQWYQEYQEVCPGTKMMIVATKSDLLSENNIDSNEIYENILTISSKTGNNVKEVIPKLIKLLEN